MAQDHQQPLKPKIFRQLVYVSLVIFFVLIRLLYKYKPTGQRPVLKQPVSAQPTFVPGQTVPQGQELSFVAVNGTKTLLVSAYQEHRIEKKVRVIAVVLRSETVDYRCLLYCQDQVHNVKGVSHIHIDHFNYAYGTADIMCSLPSSCETPFRVAVVSAAAKSEDSTLDKSLEVKNHMVKHESFPYAFTVCFSTMFDYNNVLQLVQSLEMLQILGVDRVVIYLTSCSPEIQDILDYYSKKGLVEMIPWPMSKYLNVSQGFIPSLDPGDIHYYGQIPALTDCVYRYMYQTRYMALHDTDELILPQTVNSWLELLPILEKKYGADKCYMFENNVFPINTTKPPPGSQTLTPQSTSWQNVPGVNILDHLYQEPIIKETHYSNFKIIVNPRAVFTPTVHGLLKSKNGCSWVDRNIARMYHTRSAKQTNLTPKQMIYDGRLLSYSDRLTPAVNTVLRESGLVP